MATNFKQPGKVVTMTWATTSPSAGDAVAKVNTKAKGGMIGVALNGVAFAGESIDMAREGVFSLPVVAGAAMGKGDYVFASIPATVEVCTTILSEANTGLIFGQLLTAITAAATVTVDVALLQPSHL